ncbi:hypothetical protein PMIN03_006644 [Paraphaeosphaeria minitans]
MAEAAATLHTGTGSKFTPVATIPKSEPDELNASSRDMFNRTAFVFLLTSYGSSNFSIQTQIRQSPTFHSRALPRSTARSQRVNKRALLTAQINNLAFRHYRQIWRVLLSLPHLRWLH